EQAAHKALDHALKDAVIAKSNLPQAMTAAGIAIDKMRLLRELPTSRPVVSHELDPETQRRIDELGEVYDFARDYFAGGVSADHTSNGVSKPVDTAGALPAPEASDIPKPSL